jgi:hypothetical protein
VLNKKLGRDMQLLKNKLLQKDYIEEENIGHLI